MRKLNNGSVVYEKGDKLGGRFVVQKELEKNGAQSVVYQVRDEISGRIFAAKVCDTNRVGVGNGILNKFHREGEVHKSLDDVVPRCAPRIFEILDNTKDGCSAIVMELIKGGDLFDRTKPRKRKPKRKFGLLNTVNVTLQVLRTLHVLHQRGIVDRDLKRENILLDKGDCPGVYLTDFETCTAGNQHCVRTTPLYCPPEGWDGAMVMDDRSDLYSLGVILYRLLTGKFPFWSPSKYRLELKHRNMPPPAMSKKIPRPLRDMTMKLLAKEPDDRYQSAREVALDLMEFVLNGRFSLPVTDPYYPIFMRVTDFLGEGTGVDAERKRCIICPNTISINP